MPVGTSGHKGHETVNFGGQEVKDQGHITLGWDRSEKSSYGEIILNYPMYVNRTWQVDNGSFHFLD